MPPTYSDKFGHFECSVNFLTSALLALVLALLQFYSISKNESNICIKFCLQNKIKSENPFRMLLVTYGDDTLAGSTVYRWYKMFSNDREKVWTTMTLPDAEAHQQQMKTLMKWRKWSWPIVESLLLKLLRAWTYRLACAIRLLPKVWENLRNS